MQIGIIIIEITVKGNKMAFATIVNKNEIPGEVSCVVKDDGNFAYLYEFKESGSDRTLIGKMPLIEKSFKDEITYGQMANAGERANVNSVKVYMNCQNDAVSNSDIFDNKKIVVKSDAYNRKDTINRICDIFKDRNEAEHGERKLFVRDVPNITLSAARSILFQTMQLNAAMNSMFFDKYKSSLSDAIEKKVNEFAPEDRQKLRKAGVETGMAYANTSLIEKDENLKEEEFSKLVKSVQRDYASLSITSGSNDGISLNDKEGLNSTSTSNFASSFEDANGKNQSFKIIRAFLRADKVGVDGAFEGELSFVLTDRANKLKGIKNSYSGIPVKGIVENVLRGTLRIDETPKIGRRNGQDFDYNGFNRLSENEQAFVKKIVVDYNENFKKTFDRTIEKISNGFKVPTKSEFDAEVEAKVQEDANAIRKFAKREPEAAELDEARANYRKEVEQKYRDGFEVFLQELPGKIADSFGAASSRQVGVTIAQGIQSLFNDKEYGDKMVHKMLNELFEYASVKDGISNMNAQPFSEVFNRKVEDIVYNTAKILGISGVGDIGVEREYHVNQNKPQVKEQEAEVEDNSSKLIKLNKDVMENKKDQKEMEM